MSPGDRVLFVIGERLHMSAAAVETLSTREVAAWAEYFAPPPEREPETIAPMQAYNREQLRAMFHHGR